MWMRIGETTNSYKKKQLITEEILESFGEFGEGFQTTIFSFQTIFYIFQHIFSPIRIFTKKFKQ